MNLFFAKLPSDPFGPVHIFSPKIYKYIMDSLVLIFVIGLLLWLLKKVFVHNPIETEASLLNKEVRKVRLDLLTEIEKVKTSFLSIEQARNGFFLLAKALRSYYHKPNATPIEGMTAEEIKKKIREKDITELIDTISKQQYNVEEPSLEELEKTIEAARKVAKRYKKITQVS